MVLRKLQLILFTALFALANLPNFLVASAQLNSANFHTFEQKHNAYLNICGADESWLELDRNSEKIIRVASDDELRSALEEALPGHHIILEPGTYKPIRTTLKGTSRSPIRISAAPHHSAIFKNGVDGLSLSDSQYVVIRGLTCNHNERSGIHIVESSHIAIKDCVTRHNGRWGIFTGFVEHLIIERNLCTFSATEHGIYVSNSSDFVTIRRNMVMDNAASGIQINADRHMGGDGIITYCIVSNNVILNNGLKGGSAINLDGIQYTLISHNSLINNQAGGIALYQFDGTQGSSHNVVYKNSIYQAVNGRWAININSNSIENQIIENYIYTQHEWRGSISLDESSAAGFRSSQNTLSPWFSMDGGETRISLKKWKSLGYGQGSVALNE